MSDQMKDTEGRTSMGLDKLCIGHMANVTGLVSDGPLSMWIVDEIETYFPNLQKMNLNSIYPSSNAFDRILKLNHLKECVLHLEDYYGEEQKVTKIKNNEARQLSLDKLDIKGDLSQPSVINFLQRVESFDIKLISSSKVAPALNALSTITTRCSIFSGHGSTPELLDIPLKRFRQLQHLELSGRAIELSKWVIFRSAGC
jgi:hypothetical protein